MTDKTNKPTFSIKGLTALQCILLGQILDEVKDNIEYDSDLKAYRVASENIVMSFNDEEAKAILSMSI